MTVRYSLVGLRRSASQHSVRLLPSGGLDSFDSYFARSLFAMALASVSFIPATACPTSADILGSTGVVRSSYLFDATPTDSIERPAVTAASTDADVSNRHIVVHGPAEV